jgi:hypothetical protein
VTRHTGLDFLLACLSGLLTLTGPSFLNLTLAPGILGVLSMADASSDWAGRLASDQALSSDEEGFVSSQSTASADPETRNQKHLSSALGNLHLDTLQHSSQSSNRNVTRTSTPGAGAPVMKKKLELLDLPLDVLKEIVKEV